VRPPPTAEAKRPKVNILKEKVEFVHSTNLMKFCYINFHFRNTWSTVTGHPNEALLNFLQSLTTRRTHELAKTPATLASNPGTSYAILIVEKYAVFIKAIFL
jgi:hypothetical protein